ncbi:MAG: RnfABCDGE type electron transport complex subunit A [Oscillospiraceae bacterium]|nr:RnfABCDGE type electron transport complex subunit A [Oscillospiraceae bacterium]
MEGLFGILISGILTENFVLSKTFGICPFLGVSKKLSSSLGMGAAVIFVMLFATLLTHPIYTYLLVPNDAQYLKTIAFILIIALFVQLVEMFLKRFVPPLYKALGIYLPLITTNCAVLGVTVLNVDNEYSFAESICNALAGGIGFTLALLMFAGVRSRIDNDSVPESLRGVPITLIAASIVSLCFIGFSGI